ncbi:hypothetical protein [Lichenibacterium ramalinae]|uniref:hypothetical protein n=1 Tax=Lichenibacterium ramalinae TaxID=2316527 RepID=UPI00100F6327|nr:hypothetical protein [Lichenibacterium ramalinae]
MARIKRAVVALGCLAAGLCLQAYRPAGRTPPPEAVAAAPAVDMVDPAPASPPPAPTETPYRLVLAALPREAFPDVQQQGSTLSVRYRIDHWMFNDAAGRSAFDRNAAQIVPDLFARFPLVDTVGIEADAATVDIRGHKGRAVAASVEFSRRTAAGIRWEAIDTASIEQLADAAWYGRGFERTP